MGNLEIRKFQQTIIAFANQSQLPIEVKRLVFCEIISQLQEASDNAVKNELVEAQKESEKEGVTDEQSL